jgi:hypothetical protein
MPGANKSVKTLFIETFSIICKYQEGMIFAQHIDIEFISNCTQYDSERHLIICDFSTLEFNDFNLMVDLTRMFYNDFQHFVLSSYLIGWFDQKIFFNLSAFYP